MGASGRLRTRAGAVATVLLCYLLTAGCGSSPSRSHQIAVAARAVAAARASGRNLYYLGPRYRGLALTAWLDEGLVTAVYGSCTPSGGLEASCVPPIEIQTVQLHVAPGDPVWAGCTRRVDVRGAAAVEIGGDLMLLPGNIGVQIHTDGKRSPTAIAAAVETITGSVTSQVGLPPTAGTTLQWINRYCRSTPSSGLP